MIHVADSRHYHLLEATHSSNHPDKRDRVAYETWLTKFQPALPNFLAIGYVQQIETPYYKGTINVPHLSHQGGEYISFVSNARYAALNLLNRTSDDELAKYWALTYNPSGFYKDVPVFIWTDQLTKEMNRRLLARTG